MSSGPAAAVPVAPRRVPESFVRAELASFPLTSEVGFRRCLLDLDPALEVGRPTYHLWRQCEQDLCQHAAGLSLDRMVAIRDRTWFEPSAGDHGTLGLVPMHAYLRALAASHFEARYGTTELRREESSDAGGEAEVDTVVHHQWLTFSMPQDLLLAAIRIDPPPTRIDLGHGMFERRLLDLGAAEIHQHRGAGWEFPLVWVGGLAALADPALDPERLHSPGAPLDEGRALGQWLLAAAIARVVMAEFFMAAPPPNGGPEPTLRDFLAARPRCCDHAHAWRTLQGALTALCYGQDEALPPFEALHALYGDLHPMGVQLAAEPPAVMDDVWMCDPIAVRRRTRFNYGDGERWLIRSALAYLETPGRNDPDLARTFWQLQRLRCFCYRYVVERPLTAGLAWFIRFYERSHPLRATLRKLQPEASFRISGHDLPVMAALEVRTSSDDDPIDFAEDVRDMVVSWRQVLETSAGVRHWGNELELGVIIGFNKQRDPERAWLLGHPRALGEHTHAQPHGPHADVSRLPTNLRAPWRLRFAEFLESQSPKATALADLFAAVPLTLWLIRGLDVSADELGVPTWVLVPLFHYVRQEAAYAALALKARSAPSEPAVPRLHTTAHVGEDFRHLLEGMRRIYECVRFLLDRAGGRLGHAMALGVEPRMWAESAGAVLMPLEDRLWDLVFEWRLYNGFRVPREFVATAPLGRAPRVENQIIGLARELWPSPERDLGPRDLAELQDELHGFLIPETQPMLRGDLERALERGSWRLRPPGLAEGRSLTARLLLRYLESGDLYRAGQRLVDVPIDTNEVAGMTAVQDALRRGVSQRGIVVEVNPTSNLLIGDVLDLRHHPLLRLYPIEPDDTSPAVSIAIGSDDPLTFSTSLAGEYAMMYEAARGAGYSTSAVEGWLDRIRQTALDARFTCAWRPCAREMALRLEGALDRYLQAPRALYH